jgi:hypothetical protein
LVLLFHGPDLGPFWTTKKEVFSAKMIYFLSQRLWAFYAGGKERRSLVRGKGAEMTPNDYTGFKKEKISSNPMLQLAWDIAQIVDDDAPVGWWKYKMLAENLLMGYEMKRKGWCD